MKMMHGPINIRFLLHHLPNTPHTRKISGYFGLTWASFEFQLHDATLFTGLFDKCDIFENELKDSKC